MISMWIVDFFGIALYLCGLMAFISVFKTSFKAVKNTKGETYYVFPSSRDVVGFWYLLGCMAAVLFWPIGMPTLLLGSYLQKKFHKVKS